MKDKWFDMFGIYIGPCIDNGSGEQCVSNRCLRNAVAKGNFLGR